MALGGAGSYGQGGTPQQANTRGGRAMTMVFGTAPDGTDVLQVTLTHAGTTARLMTWGASLTDFRIEGLQGPMVLGSDNFDRYLTDMHHFGAIAGPVANRIAGGAAPLGAGSVQLERNENGITHLHGGRNGTSQSNWVLEGADDRSCHFALTVPDGTGGLPGPLHLGCSYRIDDDGALALELTGRAEQPSFCNLAQHSYWALDGGAGGLSRHELTIQAERYLPVDGALIPLGDPAPVDGTRFDFRQPRPVICEGDGLLDHNFCLDPAKGGPGLRPVCTLKCGAAQLTVETDQPGLQVYDGGHINLTGGLEGRRYGPHGGLAIEPQRWPDAPNHPGYPSVTLDPGETYRQHSRFRVQKVGG